MLAQDIAVVDPYSGILIYPVCTMYKMGTRRADPTTIQGPIGSPF